MWAFTNNNIQSLPSAEVPRRQASRTGMASAVRTLLVHASPLPRLRAWARRGAFLDELYGLDDRSLADLGITRGDFPRILDGSYRRGD